LLAKSSRACNSSPRHARALPSSSLAVPLPLGSGQGSGAGSGYSGGTATNTNANTNSDGSIPITITGSSPSTPIIPLGPQSRGGSNRFFGRASILGLPSERKCPSPSPLMVHTGAGTGVEWIRFEVQDSGIAYHRPFFSSSGSRTCSCSCVLYVVR
jgi:hypothetical protein